MEKENEIVEILDEQESVKEYKVKEFKFRDIQKMAEFITKLGLTEDDLKKITKTIFNRKSSINFSNPTEIEEYLRVNFTKEQIQQLYLDNDNDVTKVGQAVKEHYNKNNEKNDELVILLYQLVNLVAFKFDIVAEFMSYFLIGYTQEQVLDFDMDEAVGALQAIFTQSGFTKFFSRI